MLIRLSKLIVCLLALCLPAALGAADKEAKPVLAVVPFQLVSTDGKVAAQSDGITRGLEDALQASLTESQRVVLVERAELEKAFRERNLVVADLDKAANAANAGSLLRADLIVVGRVRALEKEFNASVRVIACSSGEVLGATELQGDAAALGQQVSSMAAEILAAVTRFNPNSTQSIPGGADDKQASVEALKHHERAISLKTARAFEAAAGEELLALSADATMNDADLGFLDALAKAGFQDLAKAEALARIQADKTNDKNPLLKELANLQDAPRPPAAPAVESFQITCAKKLTEWLDQQGKSGNVDALRDAYLVWNNLGDRYAEEGRDGLALQAYKESASRLQKLRAADPRSIIDGNMPHQLTQMSAPEYLLEKMARSRFEGRIYFASSADENARWQEVLNSSAKKDMEPPPATYVLSLPIIDSAYLAGSRMQRSVPGITPPTSGGYHYLFKVDTNALPPGTVVLSAEIRTKENASLPVKELQLITQRWVGSEVTLTMARKGVPWRAVQNSGTVTMTGRELFGGKLMTVTEGLNAMLGMAHPGHGFRTFSASYSPPANEAGGGSTVSISAIFPPGKQPAGAVVAPSWHAEAGLCAYLRGDKQGALKEWRMVYDSLEKPAAPNVRYRLKFWENLIKNCEGAKP